MFFHVLVNWVFLLSLDIFINNCLFVTFQFTAIIIIMYRLTTCDPYPYILKNVFFVKHSHFVEVIPNGLVPIFFVNVALRSQLMFLVKMKFLHWVIWSSSEVFWISIVWRSRVIQQDIHQFVSCTLFFLSFYRLAIEMIQSYSFLFLLTWYWVWKDIIIVYCVRFVGLRLIWFHLEEMTHPYPC